MFNNRINRRNVLCIAVCILMLSLLSGCSFLQTIKMNDPNPLMTKAKVSMKDSRYGIAIAQLVNLRAETFNNDEKAEATYLLGECYFNLKSYYDAKKEFEKCTNDYSNTQWETKAKEYLDIIKAQYEESDEKKSEEIAKAQKKISELEDKLQNGYKKPDIHLELGHAYWELGKYDKAAESYLTAISLNNSLKNDPQLKERLIFDIDGKIVPIKGKDRIEIEKAKNPVVIYNTYDSLMRDRRTGILNMYVVTGQVKNQSMQPILDLTVDVTLFNLSGNVIDVNRVFVGKVFPGEVRSFVSISNYLENVYNVSRYECNLFYDHN